MTLGNMRHLGVQRLVATCLSDARPDIRVSSTYRAIPPTPRCRVLPARSCAPNAERVAATSTYGPNWKEQPRSEILTGKRWQ
jgi:hypothetical protein